MIVDGIIAHMEGDLTTMSTHRRSTKVRDMLAGWKADSPGAELPREAEWELWALDLMPLRRDPREQRTERRFGALIEFQGGRAYPDVAALMEDDEALAYYRKRAEETSNPIQRARYADILWEAFRSRGVEDAHRFGEMAVRSYVEVAGLCVEQDVSDGTSARLRGIELADALTRAAEVTRQLNNEDLGASVAEAILESLRGLPAEERYRWVIDLGFALLSYAGSRFSELVPAESLEEVRGICEEGVSYHEDCEQRNLNILDDLMQLSSGLSKMLGDDSGWWRWQVEMAQSWEKEAHYRESGDESGPGSLVAFKFAEEALRRYQRLGSLAADESERLRIKRKVEELKTRVRGLMRASQAEMKEISVSADVSTENLDKMVAPFLEAGADKLFEMLPSLLPKVDRLRAEAKEAATRNVFSSIFPRVSLRDGRKIDETGAFEGQSIQFQLQLNVWFQLHAQFLDYLLWRLREAGLFTAKSLLAHVEGWPLLEDRDFPFLHTALECYFEEDYVATVHILAPRIERMLKGVFERVGVSPIVLPDDRRIREQTLGDFLARSEVREALGESVSIYLSYALIDEQGLNLRNEVAHGWIDYPSCNRPTAQILLFIIILLTGLEIVERPEEQPPPSGPE